MLSISNQTALCLTGLVVSGCMQSMPTAESLTRPTVEAFARLSSWTPWKPTSEQAPALVIVETPPPSEVAAPDIASVEPAAKPRAIHRSLGKQRSGETARLATARRVPIPTTPARAEAVPEGAPLLPARMSCQTTSQPGERVRMECKPAE